MSEINTYEARILTILIKADRYMTTAAIAKKARMSWNTAEKYLKGLHKKEWLDRKGNRTSHWKALVG